MSDAQLQDLDEGLVDKILLSGPALHAHPAAATALAVRSSQLTELCST